MPARNNERLENTCRAGNLLIDLEILRKEENAQRRKVRIQQVRLQSKDIANKVLRDIRNEKDRQFKSSKAKDDDEFKKWQERKISEVNLLYKENINRLGEAYRNAENEPDPEQEIEERSQKLTAIAKDRGKKAMDVLRREQENAKMNKESSAARREKVRKVENIRSSLISSLPSTGTNGFISQEPTDSEANFYGRSASSSNEKEESIEMIVEEVTHPRSQPKIPNLSLGSSERPTEKISAPTSSKSTQNPKQPVAFTVDLYDRSNPCTFTRRPPNTVRVEKISSDAWRSATEAAAEEEKKEVERKQKKDKEQKATEERGKKALAKELIRRDFDQLMIRLDGLARKERLVRGLVESELPVDMYMSESRCAARTEKRQRNMDAMFEGMLFSDEVKETQKVLDTHSPPSIEKATVPEDWLPILSETPPEILNVGLESKDTTRLSIDNVIDEENPPTENISVKETSRSSPPLILSKEETPSGRKAESKKKGSKKDVKEPITSPSKGKTRSRPEDVQDSVQSQISDKDAHTSFDGKKELIQRTEACTQTKDLTKNDESSLKMEESTEIPREESEPSESSTQDSSMKFEEVRVVVRFNESSSPSTEESGLSQSASAWKVEKMKKAIVWKKQCKMTLDKEMKTVINLGSPDKSMRKGDKEQESKILPVCDSRKQKKRRKRSKEGAGKTEKSEHVSPRKSTDPVSPSPDDIASEMRAKALLKEVRAQRKEIERLRAGLSEPKAERPLPITPPLMGCYVRRLLSMTRESVEALSVSDVSTPNIRFDTPMQVRSPAEEESLKKFEVEKVDKATSPVPCSVLSVDETVSLETTSKKLTSSSKSSSTVSLPASSTSISLSSDSSPDAAQAAAVVHRLSPDVHHKPPSPSFPHHSPLTPPPSPEYEHLADLHSRRIHDLGNQLAIVRELQKKILSLDGSSESEKSSSPSVSTISKDSEKSSSSAHSVIRTEPLPLKVGEVERNWDFPDQHLSPKESLEDISLPEDIFADLEKPLRLSQDISSLRRKSTTKSGPPPTPLKGLKWSDFDYQVPHELSTITEVDSKLVSTLSVLEPRKDKDLHTSIPGPKERLSPETVTKTASPEHPEEKHVQPIKEPTYTFHTPEERVEILKSPSLRATTVHEKSVQLISDSDTRISEPDLVEKSLESGSISPNSSDDSQLPHTLEDVIRMLGISPTIFQRPHSPLENIVQESSAKKPPSPSIHSDSKANSLEENVVMQKDDVEQVSELYKEIPHSSESFGKSPFGTSSYRLLHSTPLHSSSSGTTSSSSESKLKNTSGFPFFGESAPSSICSNGTPNSITWKNLDDDSAPPKEG